MAIQQVRINGGVEMTALTGSGFVINSGGFFTLKSGGLLSIASGSNLNVAGTITLASAGALVLNASATATFNAGTTTTFSGVIGNTANVAYGDYAVVTVDGPGTFWANGGGTTTSFTGTGSGAALCNLVFGAFVDATWTGASSSMTISAGAWSWTAGTLTIGASTTFSVAATISRSGADLPSGNGAISYLRDDAAAPSTTNGSFNATVRDTWILPAPLGVNVTLTLAAPSHPCDVTFILPYADTFLTNSYTIQGAVPRVFFNGGHMTAVTFRWTVSNGWLPLSTEMGG